MLSQIECLKKTIVAFLKTIPDGNARNYQDMGKTSAVELPWTHNTPVIYDAGPRYHAP